MKSDIVYDLLKLAGHKRTMKTNLIQEIHGLFSAEQIKHFIDFHMVLWFPFPPYFHIKEDGFYGISGFIAVFLKNEKQLLRRKSVTGKHQKTSKYSEPECWWLYLNKNKPQTFLWPQSHSCFCLSIV